MSRAFLCGFCVISLVFGCVWAAPASPTKTSGPPNANNRGVASKNKAVVSAAELRYTRLTSCFVTHDHRPFLLSLTTRSEWLLFVLWGRKKKMW